MSINKFKSKHQDIPFRGSLSFISGIPSSDDTLPAEQKNQSSESERELGQLQQELLMLISELEELVLDEDL